jgi:hypothetical protein
MTRILLALFIGLASSLVLPALAQQQEKRLALVIGNGAYAAGALETTANDAGLVAQTLQAAGSRCRGPIFVQHRECEWADGCCHPSFICGQI